MPHQLTIRVTFPDTRDDIDGRREAWWWMKEAFISVEKLASDGGTAIKLQRLVKGGPPKPVALGGVFAEETTKASDDKTAVQHPDQG